MIDVQLSRSKTGTISVNDNDCPEKLAKEFCRIFTLDENSQKSLIQVIIEHMKANNLKIGSMDDEYEGEEYSEEVNIEAEYNENFEESVNDYEEIQNE